MSGELVPFVQHSIPELMEVAAKIGPVLKMQADQALVLMLIAESECMHYMQGLRTYHIIEGKPSMRADAMLAKFQKGGGRVEWVEFTAQRAAANFSHPRLQPEPLLIELTWEQAAERGLPYAWNKETKKQELKANWEKSCAAMLRARVVSAGIRMIDPNVVVGIYTPEEIDDMRTVEGTVVASETNKPNRHEKAKQLTADADERAKQRAEARAKEMACQTPAPDATMTTTATNRTKDTAPTAVPASRATESSAPTANGTATQTTIQTRASSTHQTAPTAGAAASASPAESSAPSASRATAAPAAPPAPTQRTPAKSVAILPSEPGPSLGSEQVTWLKLEKAGRTLVALVGGHAATKTIAKLNERYQCGIDPKSGRRAMSLCPADCMRSYLEEIEEEIRSIEIENHNREKTTT